MNYWLISLPREDLANCIKHGVFGRDGRGSLPKIRRGDKIVCYVTKDCRVIALGEATSEYYMDDAPVFLKEGLFPDRFKFKAKFLSPEKEIGIRSILDDLHFVTNKYYWSIFFRSSLRMIPENDYNTIAKRCL